VVSRAESQLVLGQSPGNDQQNDGADDRTWTPAQIHPRGLASHRLITLVEVGGVGKTRLTFEVIVDPPAQFRNDRVFVDLSVIQIKRSSNTLPARSLCDGYRRGRHVVGKTIFGCGQDEVAEIRSLGKTRSSWRQEILTATTPALPEGSFGLAAT
jgi:hypothetical protein